ncbi:MAG: hypothetical protein H0X02_07065 [Nitrosomonas sp.]|nr:hypothetical protein [Nitrosomonas sp.]
MSREYFAKLEPKELVAQLIQRRKAWFRYAERTGLKERHEKAFAQYYGQNLDGTVHKTVGIQSTGKNGELKAININHFRNLIRHVLALTVPQKPSFDPKAINSDVESMNQTRKARNVLDYYVENLRVGQNYYQATEQAIVSTKSFMSLLWDKSKGKPFGVKPVQGPDGEMVVDEETGQPKQTVMYEGDIRSRTHSLMNVRYDRRIRDWRNVNWVELEDTENRYDLAALHPELADDILNHEDNDDIETNTKQIDVSQDGEDDETDTIACYYFFHKPSPALPKGMYVKFLSEDIILEHGDYEYGDTLCVFRLVPGEIPDTTEGYSDATDLLVLNEVVNVLASIEFSNLNAFAQQVIWAPATSNITSEQIAQGLTLIKGGQQGDQPVALQLSQTPPALTNAKNQMVNDMEKIIGINSVVRGDPEHNLKSGAALGRVQAMAIQYASNLVRAIAELQMETGTFLMWLIQNKIKNERTADIGGKHSFSSTAQFSGDSFSNIRRVGIEMSNPLSKTISGRLELADGLMQKGMLKNPKEYFSIANTGQIDQLTEGDESQNNLVRQENEAMMEGQPVQAIVGDKHVLHMQEHSSLLANPSVRLNSPIAQAVIAHIQEHMMIYKTQDPMWSMVSGEPPAPVPPPMMGPPPGPGGMPPSGPQPNGPAMPPPEQGPPMAEPPPIPPMPQGPA